MRTLRLTSPQMRGVDVSAAQKRLRGDNVYKGQYSPGAVDGVFGEQTSAACYRAKWWLGFPPAKLIRSYGDTLEAYLSGKRKLPSAYASRRAARKAEARKKKLREKALAKAVTQLGVKEQPAGSNRVKFSDWYGLQGPWCAMFATWCYEQVGSDAFARGARWAYVPYIVNDARAGRNNLAITHEPKPGDLVCFDWEGNGVSDHVGLLEKLLGGGELQTIEGNTAVGNDSNGGQVMRRKRSRSSVQVFVHVGR